MNNLNQCFYKLAKAFIDNNKVKNIQNILNN